MRFWPSKVKGHPEDAAIRVALRDVARQALALDNLLAGGHLRRGEPQRLYVAAIGRAARVAEMQWGDACRPAREALAALSESRRRDGEA